MNSILWLLLGHSVAEFCLLTDRISNQKRLLTKTDKFPWPAYLAHGLTTVAVLFLALWIQRTTLSVVLVLCAVFLGIAHVAVDLMKNVTLRHQPLMGLLNRLFGRVDEGVYRAAVWVLSQTLHLGAIWLVSGIFFPPLYDLVHVTNYVNRHIIEGAFTVAYDQRLPYILLLVVLGTFGGADFIKFTIRALHPGNSKKITHIKTRVAEEISREASEHNADITKKPENGVSVLAISEVEATSGYRSGRSNLVSERTETREDTETTDPEPPAGSGRWIGILERLLIMILVPMNAWQGVGFILTAKSLARYRQLENRGFAEYYIVGTLISTIIGILFGLLIGRALGTIKA